MAVFLLQGYFSELDNSELSHLIPLALQNKRDVLFGNLPEIYDFHNRYSLSLCGLQAASLLLLCLRPAAQPLSLSPLVQDLSEGAGELCGEP